MTRFGERVSPLLLDEMIRYCHRLDEVEKMHFKVETFKGKNHLWAEKLPSGHYVLYGNEKDDWFAEYYDPTGVHMKSAKNTQPFDFRRE